MNSLSCSRFKISSLWRPCDTPKQLFSSVLLIHPPRTQPLCTFTVSWGPNGASRSAALVRVKSGNTPWTRLQPIWSHRDFVLCSPLDSPISSGRRKPPNSLSKPSQHSSSPPFLFLVCQVLQQVDRGQTDAGTETQTLWVYRQTWRWTPAALGGWQEMIRQGCWEKFLPTLTCLKVPGVRHICAAAHSITVRMEERVMHLPSAYAHGG